MKLPGGRNHFLIVMVLLAAAFLASGCQSTENLPATVQGRPQIPTPSIIFQNPSIQGIVTEVIQDGDRVTEIVVEKRQQAGAAPITARVHLLGDSRVFVRETDRRYVQALPQDLKVGISVEAIFTGLTEGLDPVVGDAKEVIIVPQMNSELQILVLPNAGDEPGRYKTAAEKPAASSNGEMYIPLIIREIKSDH